LAEDIQLFGSDEMLLGGLCGGAHGAVGSTLNFAAPLYNRIIEAFERRDLAEAQRLPGLSVQMVKQLYRCRGQPAFKAMMKLVGVDCGPSRLPLIALEPDEVTSLKKNNMERLDFLDGAR